MIFSYMIFVRFSSLLYSFIIFSSLRFLLFSIISCITRLVASLLLSYRISSSFIFSYSRLVYYRRFSLLLFSYLLYSLLSVLPSIIVIIASLILYYLLLSYRILSSRSPSRIVSYFILCVVCCLAFGVWCWLLLLILLWLMLLFERDVRVSVKRRCENKL